MAIWVRCSNKRGGPVFVNLSTAMSARWNEDENCTIIAYAGGDDEVRVLEKPDAVLIAGKIDFGSA